MALTAASGPIALAETYLAAQLANAAAFRTWAGAADVAAALARIDYHAIDAPADGNTHTKAELQTARPFAVIYTAPSSGYSLRMDAVSDDYEFLDGGSIIIQLEQDVPEALQANTADNNAEIMRRMLNSLGNILADVAAQSGQAGRLNIMGLEVEALARSEGDEIEAEGDYLMAIIRVDWGQRG